MRSFIVPLIYFAAATWFYLFSGSAEGFIPPRLLVFPVFLAALGHTLFILTRIIRSIFSRTPHINIGHYASIIGFLFILISFKLGTDLDNARIVESMHRGDIILDRIGMFKDNVGRCPIDLDELRNKDVQLPKPALRKSEFQYWTGPYDQCQLSFDSVAFVACRKRLNAVEWFCDD